MENSRVRVRLIWDFVYGTASDAHRAIALNVCIVLIYFYAGRVSHSVQIGVLGLDCGGMDAYLVVVVLCIRVKFNSYL